MTNDTGIFIKACEAHRDRVKAQFETWANERQVIPWYGWQLDTPDDYAGLPQKTKGICRMGDNLAFEHGFFCDTDTYVSVPRLLASDFESHDYIGYQLEGKDYASGGAGYWLSRKALRVIAACDPTPFANEDEMVGTVLKQAGIPLHHDPRYALYEDVLPGNNIISRHLSSRGPYEISFMYVAHHKANP